ITDRVRDRVALVAKGGSGLPIPFDRVVRILHDFPSGFQTNTEAETPRKGQSRQQPSQDSTQGKAVQHVRETVRIKQMLGIVRSPGIGCPQVWLTAGAPPSSSLVAQLKRRAEQNDDNHHYGPSESAF